METTVSQKRKKERENTDWPDQEEEEEEVGGVSSPASCSVLNPAHL